MVEHGDGLDKNLRKKGPPGEPERAVFHCCASV